MSSKTFHVNLDVRGAIRNGYWRKYADWSLVGHAVKEDGSLMDSDEILNELLDHVAAGHRVIPIGPACEGFSYEDGCPGHLVETEDEVSDEP